MVKRTCPLCGKTWFSCAEQDEWNCQNCGYLLSTDLNRNSEECDEKSQSDCLS